MTTQAQYATVVRGGSVAFNTANTNRDGTGTLAVLALATAVRGAFSRIDNLTLEATGATTAGMLRLFLVKGTPGENVATMNFVTTTATVDTLKPHNLVTGNRVSVQGCHVEEFNVTDQAITVTGPSTFQYTMAGTPTVVPDPAQLGKYSWTPATLEARLWREIDVTLTTPSATVKAWTLPMSSANSQDALYLPLVLPAGWSLRIATHNAENFVGTAIIGDSA